jgi:prophage antirepressor-like protein
MEATAAFNPFQIFDREVKRRFTIRPREYANYTPAQLDEMIKCQLRVYKFNDTLWFLAKDVCSFLGITPDHSKRSIDSIDQLYVRSEKVITTWAPLDGAQVCSSSSIKDPVTQMRKVCLLNEFGVYALIEKSRTTYAVEFRKWLYEKVLPTIRKTGQYTISTSISAQLEETNVNLEIEEIEAGGMDDDEVQREFEDILREKDSIIEKRDSVIEILKDELEEKQKMIEEQHEVIEQKETGINDLMSFMKMTRDENRRMYEETKHINEKNVRELTQRINALHSDNQALHVDNQVMSQNIQNLHQVIIGERILKTEDVEVHHKFLMFKTFDVDFPFCVVKGQKKYMKTLSARVLKAHKNAKVIFELDCPNGESFFQIFKERARKAKMCLINRTSFKLIGDTSIDSVIDMIKDIESERACV